MHIASDAYLQTYQSAVSSSISPSPDPTFPYGVLTDLKAKTHGLSIMYCSFLPLVQDDALVEEESSETNTELGRLVVTVFAPRWIVRGSKRAQPPELNASKLID